MNLRILFVFFGILLLSTFGFAISASLSFSDSSIGVGSSTTLTAIISGSDTGVTAELSGAGIASGDLTTSPAAVSGVSTQYVGTISGTTSTSWVIQGNTPGTYPLLVTVAGDTTSTTATITLTVTNPANVILDEYSCNGGDSNLSKGDKYIVSYTLKNTGGESATITSTPSLKYFSEDSKSNIDASNQTVIGAGETKSLAFTFKPSFGSTTRTGSVNIILTGANDPDDFSCDNITLYVAPSSSKDSSEDKEGGDTGGGTTSEKEEKKGKSTTKTKTKKTGKTVTTPKFKIVLPENVLVGETRELKITDLKGNPLKDINIGITDPLGGVSFNLTDANGLVSYTFQYDGNYIVKVYYGGKSYDYIINVKKPEAAEETSALVSTETKSKGSKWWIWVIVVVGVVVLIVIGDLIHSVIKNRPKKKGLARLK